MKRILLTLGTISTISPIGFVVACGEQQTSTVNNLGSTSSIINVELEARFKESKPGFENGTKIKQNVEEKFTYTFCFRKTRITLYIGKTLADTLLDRPKLAEGVAKAIIAGSMFTLRRLLPVLGTVMLIKLLSTAKYENI